MQYAIDGLFIIVGALLLLIGVATYRQDRDLRRDGLLVRGRVVKVDDDGAVVEYDDREGRSHRFREDGAGPEGRTPWVRYDPEDPEVAQTLGGPASWFHWVFIAVGLGLFVLTTVLIATGGGGGLAGT